MDQLMTLVALIIIAGAIGFAGFLLYKGTNGFAVAGFVLVATVAGVTTANLHYIRQAGAKYSSTQGASLGLDIDQKLAEARSDVEDVKRLAGQIDTLANDIRKADIRIQRSEQTIGEMSNAVKSDANEVKRLRQETAVLTMGVQRSEQTVTTIEQNIVNMHAALQQATREIIEIFYLDMNTRWIFGARKMAVLNQMNERFIPLQSFAYETTAQHDAAFAKMNKVIGEVQHPSPSPTPTQSPVSNSHP
jgi:hypothetical protein